MAMTVWAWSHFSAAHSAPEHSELHGHSYIVRVYVKTNTERPPSAEVLHELVRSVCGELDHHNLDRLLSPLPATMENIARYVAEAVDDNAGFTRRVTRVRVERPIEGLGVDYVL